MARLEPASYITQDSSSKLGYSSHSQRPSFEHFNLLHTAVTFRHFFTISL